MPAKAPITVLLPTVQDAGVQTILHAAEDMGYKIERLDKKWVADPKKTYVYYGPRDARVSHTKTLNADWVSTLPSKLTQSSLKWKMHFRCFVLDGKVQTSSQYQDGDGFHVQSTPIRSRDKVHSLAEMAAVHSPLRSIAIDIGRTLDGKLGVISGKESWSSELYACDPHKVLNAIVADQHPKLVTKASFPEI